MLAKSHLSLGFIGGAAIMPLLQNITTKELYLSLLLPIILIGSVFPDIDEPKSFIGKKLPLLSKIVSLSFTHRGFTHFFIFPCIFILVGIIFPHSIVSFCLFAFGYGIILHQIGDMLTISGIPYYFFPFSSKRAVLLPKAFRFKTGGNIEKCILVGIFTPIIAFIIAYYGELKGIDKNFIDFEKIINVLGEKL